MTTLTIRNLDEHTKAQLRIQAARHGRSMEDEARAILHSATEARQPVAGGKGCTQGRAPLQWHLENVEATITGWSRRHLQH